MSAPSTSGTSPLEGSSRDRAGRTSAAAADTSRSDAGEPSWPSAGGRVVFLLDACSALEKRMLEDWIRRNRPGDVPESSVEQAPIPPSRRRSRRAESAGLGQLESAIAAGGDPLMAPLRIAWFSQFSDGVRHLGTLDLLTLTDPRDPGPLRQRWTARRHPA
ncbi:MAG: hypothetical protein ABR538_04630, partial [Candidatus Binatia bacterium]